MKGFHLVPEGTKVNFMAFRQMALMLSIVAMVLSVGLFLAKGLNYGIDFIGGTIIEIRTPEKVADLTDIRKKIGSLGLGDVQIQEFGQPNDVLIRVETQTVDTSGVSQEEATKLQEKAQQAVVNKVQAALGDKVDYRRTEVVGPAVSSELVRDGTIAVIAAIFAVLFYIWVRFEWEFSLGAVVALVHDIVLTIGIFSLLNLEFNLSIIAALLTIVGYSLNDTVVVFDRVRENLRKFKKMALPELLNLSLNETLARTLMTSLTTLLALLSLYIFGGEVIRGFTFAMIWGVLVGTYSSIFIASPVLNMLGVKRDWSGNKTPAGKTVSET